MLLLTLTHNDPFSCSRCRMLDDWEVLGAITAFYQSPAGAIAFIHVCGLMSLCLLHCSSHLSLSFIIVVARQFLSRTTLYIFVSLFSVSVCWEFRVCTRRKWEK